MVQNEMNTLQEIPKHLGGINFLQATGQLAVISSNLTGRDWDGTLAVFDDPKFAPNVPHIDYGVKTESGCTSVNWINESRLVTSTDSGSLEIWDMKDRPILENSLHLSEHGDICSSVSISRHTTQIVSGGWDCLIKLWDLEVDMSINTFSVHSEKVLQVKWDTHETNVFCSVSEDQTVLVYDNRKDEKPGLVVAKTKIYYPTCLDWIDANRVVVGFSNGCIVMYDIRNPNVSVMECKSHQNYVTKLAALDNVLYSAAEDCKVYGHDINKFEVLYTDKRHKDYVQDVSINLKDKTVWSCGWDGEILCHAINSNKNVEKMETS